MEQQIRDISYQEKQIRLIGTAHVGSASSELVTAQITEFKPDSICLELDANRYQSLINQNGWEQTNLLEIIKSKRLLFMIINLYLANYQKKIASQLGSTPGQEMQTAINLAQAHQIPIQLIDRDIQITLKRALQALSTKEKLTLIKAFLNEDQPTDQDFSSELNQLLVGDNLNSQLIEFAEELPNLTRTILTERNQYMIEKIKQVPGQKVLVIVGAAHLAGIVDEFDHEYNLEQLTALKAKRFSLSWLKWLVPITILTLIIHSFTISMNLGWQNVTSWIITHSGLTALGVLIAGGSSLSILTALISAPFTALNPLIACGWLVALVETKRRTPKVRDFESLYQDFSTWRGWRNNQILRIFLITILANLGNIIATIISGTNLLLHK